MVKNWCNVLSMEGVTVCGHHPECRVTSGGGHKPTCAPPTFESGESRAPLPPSPTPL